MGGHQSAASDSDTWLTPPSIIAALGAFDLDPCAAPEPRPWPTAAVHWTREDSPLLRPWSGRVWLNPPYGGPHILGSWLRRMAEHRHGTALIFARTETDLFHECVWNVAEAVFFFRGRLTFHRADGALAAYNAGAPSCLIAYGAHDRAKLLFAADTLAGRLLLLR